MVASAPRTNAIGVVVAEGCRSIFKSSLTSAGQDLIIYDELVLQYTPSPSWLVLVR